MPSRGYLQGLRPFHDPNLLLFLHSLPILYFVRKLYRNCSKCYALHLFWTHFVHEYKSSKAVQELHLEKDDKSEIILKTYSKAQIKFRSWIVFIVIQIGLFTLLIFHKVFVQQMSLSDFVKLLMQFDKSVPFLMYSLIIGSILEP